MREERGEFLDAMGAFEPPGKPVEITAVSTVEISSNGNRNGRKPHDFKQGDPHRYRLRFAKLGVAALTGHLDFVRTLPRVLRRAGITAYYSEGFHPKPVMEFSPPLPLGVMSLGEWVDIALAEEMAPETLLERLRGSAPDGLEFLEAVALPPGSRKLSRSIETAEYIVRMDRAEVDRLGFSEVELDAAPASFLERTEVTVEVTRKRKPKVVDIRPAVRDLGWVNLQDVPLEARWTDADARYLLVRLDVSSEAHARPEEVASAMLGSDPGLENSHLLRTRLVLGERNPSSSRKESSLV
jgi:radical SAM-linked protein